MVIRYPDDSLLTGLLPSTNHPRATGKQRFSTVNAG